MNKRRKYENKKRRKEENKKKEKKKELKKKRSVVYGLNTCYKVRSNNYHTMSE